MNSPARKQNGPAPHRIFERHGLQFWAMLVLCTVVCICAWNWADRQRVNEVPTDARAGGLLQFYFEHAYPTPVDVPQFATRIAGKDSSTVSYFEDAMQLVPFRTAESKKIRVIITLVVASILLPSCVLMWLVWQSKLVGDDRALRWQHMIVPWVWFVLCAWTALLYVRSIARVSGGYPILKGVRDHLSGDKADYLRSILKRLIIDDSNQLQVEDLKVFVDRQLSHGSTLSWPDPWFHLWPQQCWCAALWIVLCLIAIVYVGWNYGMCSLSRCARIPAFGLVLLGYLSVGTAFGVLYYGQAAMGMARSNSLQLAIVRAVIPGLNGANSDSRSVPDVQHLNRLLAVANLNGLVTTTFSQDEALVVLDETKMADHREVFSATVAFQSKNQDLVDSEPLPNDAQVVVCGVPRGVTSNGDVLGEFQRMLKAHAPDQTPTSITAVFYGGADYHGSDATNDNLATQRWTSFKHYLLSQFESTGSGDGSGVEKGVADYRMMVRQSLETVQKGITGFSTLERIEGRTLDEALWPSSPHVVSRLPVDDGDWRAASVVIRESKRDPARGLVLGSAPRTNQTLVDMLYFSFVSFTTTGYGDVRPVREEARFLVIIENILEIIFTAVFFAWTVQQCTDSSGSSGKNERNGPGASA